MPRAVDHQGLAGEDLTDDFIFVTGAGGTVGRIVARTLLMRGHRVRGFGLGEQFYRSPEFFGALEKIGDFKFEIGSILDEYALVQAMRGARHVIHLAAVTGTRKAEANRLRCFDINVNGTQRVMAACVANGVEHVVNVSSSAIYGIPRVNPVPETADLQPRSAYALTKAAAEEVVVAFSKAFPNLHATTLRLFNAYSDSCATDLVLDAFVVRVAKGLPPVINGDGAQKRCFTHAEDVGEAIMRVFDVPAARSRTYNLGNPDAIMRIADLAELVIKMIGTDKAMQPQFREPPPGVAREVPDIWADISRLEKDLGFRPRISLPEGLERIRRGLSETK
jgi:nucleoside-diphosphate-sugar epimerase